LRAFEGLRTPDSTLMKTPPNQRGRRGIHYMESKVFYNCYCVGENYLVLKFS